MAGRGAAAGNRSPPRCSTPIFGPSVSAVGTSERSWSAEVCPFLPVLARPTVNSLRRAHPACLSLLHVDGGRAAGDRTPHRVKRPWLSMVSDSNPSAVDQLCDHLRTLGPHGLEQLLAE